jgi:hypothetical protein
VTVPLSTAERTRLTKLLGLLGSDHPGERDNAAVLANRLIKAKGASWDDVVIGPAPVQKSEIVTWRSTCRELQRHQGSLRTWERQFVAELPAFPRISPKQRAILDQISTRVLGRGAA